jgi:hypothetical protein
MSLARIFLFVLCFAPSFSWAQTEDVILRAMQDELKRNINELHEKDFEKPFFIGYTIDDNQVYSAKASLGAIMDSDNERRRSKNVRVLVGDYDFNDESLDNNTYSPRTESEIELPLDDDYFGIRRALWSTTDYVYKSAARQYNENLQVRKEKEKDPAFQYRSFAKAPVVSRIEAVKPLVVDKTEIENWIREISSIFLQYPKLRSSTVFVTISQTITYTVTSEGTIARIVKQLWDLRISAAYMKETGESLFEGLPYSAVSQDKLPTKNEIETAVHALCKKIQRTDELKMEEDYTGPVLFMNKAVAELFSEALFGYREKLIASDAIPNPKSNRREMGLDAKIGKLIMSDRISVKAKTPLKQFNNIDALGSYNLDDEGMEPAADLVLVEKGVLKALLNDRSIISKGQEANGHANGPGVIEVVISQTAPLDMLKKKLLEIATEGGLEFAVIVKENLRSQGTSFEVIRVDVNTGKEEIMSSAVVAAISLKNIKKDVIAAPGLALFNLQSLQQALSSYIVPTAVLLQDIEVKKWEMPREEVEHFVPSPFAE